MFDGMQIMVVLSFPSGDGCRQSRPLDFGAHRLIGLELFSFSPIPILHDFVIM